MKNLIRMEELAEFIFAILIFSKLDYSWWVFPALLLSPDLSMIGYAVNTKVGAWMYNFFHHKALGIILGTVGFLVGYHGLVLTGVILFAHSAIDRCRNLDMKLDILPKNISKSNESTFSILKPIIIQR